MLIYAAAGGMGNALIDLAKAADLVVIGVVSGDEKSKFARNLGADHVIDRKAEKVGAQIEQITRNRGVDIIIDPVGDRPSPITFGCSRLRRARPLRCPWRQGATRSAANVGLTKNSPAVRQFPSILGMTL